MKHTTIQQIKLLITIVVVAVVICTARFIYHNANDMIDYIKYGPITMEMIKDDVKHGRLNRTDNTD